MKKDIMKYTAAALLAALALTACGGSAEETTAAATTAAAEAESEATAAPTEAETEADGGSRLDAILDAGVITMATSPDFAPYKKINHRFFCDGLSLQRRNIAIHILAGTKHPFS